MTISRGTRSGIRSGLGSGRSNSELSRELGVSRGTVQNNRGGGISDGISEFLSDDELAMRWKSYLGKEEKRDPFRPRLNSIWAVCARCGKLGWDFLCDEHYLEWQKEIAFLKVGEGESGTSIEGTESPQTDKDE